MKKLFFFLFPLSLLLAGRVAVVGVDKKDAFLTKVLSKNLRPMGIRVRHETDPSKLIYYDLIVSNNYHSYLEKHARKTILVLNEPPIIVKEHAQVERLKRFLVVYTWNHDLCRMQNFEPYFFPAENQIPATTKGIPSFEEKKLACMIASCLTINHPTELYSERKAIAKYYQKKHPTDLDLFGWRGWGQKYAPIFQGRAHNKIETMQKYRFCYCYENWKSNTHYISEKIYDAFNALCIPIYLGSNQITKLIPKETFIDARDFKNVDHIHYFISHMSKQTYQKYIDAIIEFRLSEHRKLATTETFHEQITEKILEILGRL